MMKPDEFILKPSYFILALRAGTGTKAREPEGITMLSFASPAKVNLFLQILGRRPDGYHEIASLFQAIDLRDFLHFTLADNDVLECTHPDIPTGPNNLVWKAVALFKKKTNLQFNLHIKLEKNIPIEAGLGGGSSNAATTLWAINQLLGSPATNDQLMLWAAEIGSDVPFFFSTGTAYCTGRGELVQSLDPLLNQTIWIAKPKWGLSTPSVYQKVNPETLRKSDPQEYLQQFLLGYPYYFNDLEKPAFEVLPQMRQFKDELKEEGFKTVMLSGSGSSFLCIGGGVRPPSGLGSFQYRTRYVNRSFRAWYE
jgi:4-diphosphocytidyl-2-C-methyl-D-erythritol kinase